MKKIIYSIATALILSIILALIFPTWFLRGDARWTHLNDTARVDIYFEGNLKNGRVKVEGTGLRITYPKFLSVNRSQGAAVEIPVSYRTKTYKIKFTPQADEWGNDAVIVVRFLGQYLQYKGKKRPAWVVFRNITLNRQPVAGDRVVWHDQHFIQKYSLPSSEISTLVFDVHKPLAASDISFVNIAALFSAFLLLSLFFAPLKKVADRVLSFINRKEVINTLKDSYSLIDSVYRRSFWIIFGVLCFAFGLHAIWFMWGNHDWSLLEHNQRWLGHAFEGRYMVYSVKVLISNGTYLPLIYDLITFITLALNGVLLCRYWRLEKRVTYFVLCGLVLTVQPFTLCMLYYVHMTPEVFIGVTCALVALLLSEKITLTRGSLIQKCIYFFLAIVLINFSLAMYPTLMTTIAVLFVGRLVVQSFDWDGSWRQLKSCLVTFLPSVIHILLGAVSYRLLTIYAFPANYYNTGTLSLERIPERCGDLLKQSIHQLYEYDMPFLPQWILWIFLGFTLVLVLYICSTGNLIQRVIRLFLLFSALFATQTSMIIAKVHVIEGRVELFGLVFFEALVTALIIARIGKFRNLWILAGTCIIFTSVINDLDCLRVWKLGFDAEKMLWNRVLARLEIQTGFDPTKKYDVVQIGWPTAMRPRYYTGPRRQFTQRPYGPPYAYGATILTLPFDLHGAPFMAHDFYYPVSFRGRGFSSFHYYYRKDPNYMARLKRLYQAGVLQRAEAWPKPNGLIVWKDIILFVTDGAALNDIKKHFERGLGRK